MTFVIAELTEVGYRRYANMGELTALFVGTMLGFFVLAQYSEVGYEYIPLDMG